MAKSREPKRPQDPRADAEQFWWRAAVGAPVHDKVVTYGRSLQNLYRSAHQRCRALERIYEGAELTSYGSAIQALARRGFSAARLNCAKAVVNTVNSRLS